MRRKWLLVVLTQVLVLSMLMPATALAARPLPFEASGIVTSVSPGTVFPAGESGRWVVVEREMGGTFLNGDISGDFTLAYQANVELLTQSGNLHGTLETASSVLELNGTIQPLEMVPTPFGFDLPKLTITGRWTATSGMQARGTFDAWIIFIPTPDGHVAQIVGSAISLTGSK